MCGDASIPGVVVEGLQLSTRSRVVLQTAVRGALSRVAGQEHDLDRNSRLQYERDCILLQEEESKVKAIIV